MSDASSSYGFSSIIYLLRIADSTYFRSPVVVASAYSTFQNSAFPKPCRLVKSEKPVHSTAQALALRRRGREAEGTRLLNERTPKGYREFESHRLRHFSLFEQKSRSLMISPPAFLMNIPLLKRWVPSILRRYARLFCHRFVIERRMGALLLIDQKNSVDRNLMIKGAWERPQVDKLKQLIRSYRRAKQNVTFLDIGAHGALYSIILAQEDLADRIIAFEPEPTNLIQLKANLFMNDLLSRIEVIDKAVSDRAGRIPFFIGSDANRGGASMEDEHPVSEYGGSIEVDADRLDAMVEIKDNLVIGKIDVEGAEMTVLIGMEKTIATNRCLFQIESFTSNFPALKSRMEQLGCVYLETIDFDHFFLKDSI
jgi:FkbM family methyltransferase